MKFDLWCEKNPDAADRLRKRLGKKTFAKYQRGDVTRADPETISIIAKASGFQVTANDFYGISPALAAKALGQ